MSGSANIVTKALARAVIAHKSNYRVRGSLQTHQDGDAQPG